MKSLRAKLTLALLAMSFIAIAVVGVTSRWLVLRRVDDLVVERALEGFVQEAANYYETYGSWQKAREAEPYLVFSRRNRGVPFGLRTPFVSQVRPVPGGAASGNAPGGGQEASRQPPDEVTRRPPMREEQRVSASGLGPYAPARGDEAESEASPEVPARPSSATRPGGPRPGMGMSQRSSGMGLPPPPPGNRMGRPPTGSGMRRPPFERGMLPPPRGMGRRRPPAGAAMSASATEEVALPPSGADDTYQPTTAGDVDVPSAEEGGYDYQYPPEDMSDSSLQDEQDASPAQAERRSPPRDRLGRRQPPGLSRDSSTSPRPLLAEGHGGPPVPVVITNLSGTVVIPLAGMHVGDDVARDDFKRGRPIVAADKEVGVAVPLKRPERTDLEEQYLATIRKSWIYSLVLAGLLAIPIGLILGNRFATPIVELTGAIGRMRRGLLRQSVSVRGDDEITQLSSTFNEMSDQLADTYNELRASREQLTEQAEMLKELSRRDELTGLFNRRAFDEQAAFMFEQARRFDHPMTLAMVDIDHFKRVNDEYSHAIGDAVLREVAHLIGSKIREIDLVARYGGEEFAMAFPETPLDAAGQFLDKLRQIVEAHDWEKVAPGLTVTLSAGLAARTVGSSLSEVLDVADIRLHEAKTNGRNLVCF
jgi:two-component system cell cycle response regulator